MERSLEAIVQSRRLLANSEALLSYPSSKEADDATLTTRTTEQSATGILPLISQYDFEGEIVGTDGKHFCDCTFRHCTLRYSGSPVTFESCQFHDCRFEFSGAAGRTLQFLDCFGLLAERADDPSGESADSALQLMN